jgi:hypothetical protein
MLFKDADSIAEYIVWKRDKNVIMKSNGLDKAYIVPFKLSS